MPQLTLGAVGTILALAACGDSSSPVPGEPEIATMQLIIGADTVNVADNGAVTGGPLVVALGANTLTARFLRANGQPDPLVDGATFRLDGATDDASIVTFTGNQLGGTITGVASGNASVAFSLFHLAEGHDDFGPFPVPVSVP
jgi:hypothetical protein